MSTFHEYSAATYQYLKSSTYKKTDILERCSDTSAEAGEDTVNSYMPTGPERGTIYPPRVPDSEPLLPGRLPSPALPVRTICLV